MRLTLEECEAAIRPHLTPQRFYHCQCVSAEARKLAVHYGADPEKAAIAGMLHDIMKDTPREQQLKILQSFDIIMTTVEKNAPKLLHAISGACYIQCQLGVTDVGILEAVRWHTSGRAGMSLLEKVIFLADFISADRGYPGVVQLRVQAYKDLETGMLEGIDFTLRELLDKGQLVAPETIDAYNDLQMQIKQRNN